MELGGKVRLQSVDLHDSEALDNIRAELENCLDFLSDAELIEISEDDGIGIKAQEVLRKRRDGNRK